MHQNQLKKLFFEMRDDMNSKWHRVLPFGELINDRWEKADYLGFGKGTNIYDSSIIMGDVCVGTDTWIGPFTLLDGTGGTLRIGNHCSISSGTQIYTHDTVKHCLSGGDVEKVCTPTKVGNNCYIGPMVIISMGVEIGDFCVVGANSFVNKSFGSYNIIAGTPARKIGSVKISENKEIELVYHKEANPNGSLQSNVQLKKRGIITFIKSLFSKI